MKTQKNLVDIVGKFILNYSGWHSTKAMEKKRPTGVIERR